MSKRLIKNIAASVHQRLLNKARESGRPFNELLQYYAMERFLYRLTRSRHGKSFVLKGALMLIVWKAPFSRPTMDIDLLGRVENSIEVLAGVVREVCIQPVAPDGLTFDANTIHGERIAEDADYTGVRIRLRCNLGTARVNIQIDVGFSDVVVPPAKLAAYPTILDFPAPQIQTYSCETTIAEKFEAMTKLGELNSRMKDFFDIWLLCGQYEFNGSELANAIQTTFAHRRTEVLAEPVCLTHAFAADPARGVRWQAFLRRSRLKDVPQAFPDVVLAIGAFLRPVAVALTAGKSFKKKWRASGPWT